MAVTSKVGGATAAAARGGVMAVAGSGKGGGGGCWQPVGRSLARQGRGSAENGAGVGSGGQAPVAEEGQWRGGRGRRRSGAPAAYRWKNSRVAAAAVGGGACRAAAVLVAGARTRPPALDGLGAARTGGAGCGGRGADVQFGGGLHPSSLVAPPTASTTATATPYGGGALGVRTVVIGDASDSTKTLCFPGRAFLCQEACRRFHSSTVLPPLSGFAGHPPASRAPPSPGCTSHGRATVPHESPPSSGGDPLCDRTRWPVVRLIGTGPPGARIVILE